LPEIEGIKLEIGYRMQLGIFNDLLLVWKFANGCYSFAHQEFIDRDERD
jgi:hypothetical protein